MKSCNKCNVKILDDTNNCPLCKTPLTDFDGIVSENIYPKLEIKAKEYNFIKKIFFVFSLMCAAIAAFINYITYNGVLWSIILFAAILYIWAIIIRSIKNSMNVASKILEHAFFASILIVVIDNVLGYSGWAINYVIPELIILANIAIVILIIVNRMNWHNYVLYQIVIALFGFVPIILFLLKVIQKPLLSIIAAAFSAVTLLVTILFSDKSVKSELKRRFHF